MKISSKWLREWINPEVSDKQLAEKLTMSGIEVDGIQSNPFVLKNVVVGKIIACEKHPNADKLNICEVDVGEVDNLQIICGAFNARANIKVAVAKIGAKLPNNIKIKKSKIREIYSSGMLCSEEELGISKLNEGIIEIDINANLGDDITKYLDLYDNIFELDITPNRGDCFSVWGLSREIAAIYNLDFNIKEQSYKSNLKNDFPVKILNNKACPKYLTRVIKNVDNRVKTPDWIVRKLNKSAQATNSAVVDIINYVLLETGQPMHVFDIDKISENIEVRMANVGEKIALLNSQEVTLKENTLVIADSKNPIAIAGVMGGMESATQSYSKNILIESAFFATESIAGIARSYGLHTESSIRFERGVDFNLTRKALERATNLILDICEGEATEVAEFVAVENLPKLEPIKITFNNIFNIIGFPLDKKWIEDKIKLLGFNIVDKDNDYLIIIAPSFRFDIKIEADVVEELLRLYGYDLIPNQTLNANLSLKPTEQSSISNLDLSQTLVNRGYREIITYSFISSKYNSLLSPENKNVEILNPISQDMAIMRNSLWPGLLQTIQLNKRRGNINCRFFEIGLCFDGTDVDQQIYKIAGAITGRRYINHWANDIRDVDFFDIKADLESILSLSEKEFRFEKVQDQVLQNGQSANIIKNDKIIGKLGLLSPVLAKKLAVEKVFLFEVLLSEVNKSNIPSYNNFSLFQASQRDIALVIDEDIEFSRIITAIKDLKQKYLIDVFVFDVYSGQNIELDKKSIALSLKYQSNTKTLSDNDINKNITQIISRLQKLFKVELR